MSRRTWLVSVSIVGHVAIGLGLFASGIWKLERLESDRRLSNIGVMTPSFSSGGAPELPEVKFQKKEQRDKTVAKNVQWDKRVPREEPKITKPGGGGDGNTEGTGNKEGEGPPGDGPLCTVPPCEPPKQPEVTMPEPPKPKPPILTPQQMKALRLDGETQVHPSRNVKNQITGDGKTQVTASVKFCIETNGSVGSATLLASTKYPEYDQQLVEAVRRWRYRPHLVNGVPTPACSVVNFVYAIR